MAAATLDNAEMDLMEKIINENYKDIKVVAKTNSGKEVLEKAEEGIDLIVLSLDIKEVNGLETIKKLKQINEKIHIILVTRFDSADIINHAVFMGVEGYLTKPIAKTAFLEAINKSVEHILQDEENTKEKEKEKRHMDIGMELAEHSFIYSMLFNSSFQADIEKYKELFGISSYGYIVNVEVTKGLKKFENTLLHGDEKLYHIIKKTIPKTQSCIIGPRMEERIIIYVSIPEEEKNKWYKTDADAFAEELRKNFEDELDLNVWIGMGSIAAIENVHKSYEESLAALRYANWY